MLFILLEWCINAHNTSVLLDPSSGFYSGVFPAVSIKELLHISEMKKALYMGLWVLVMKAKTSKAQVHEFSFDRFCVWIPELGFFVFFCFSLKE